MQPTDKFMIQRSVEDGIERVTYTPKFRRFGTPILMQHGMWHGAWCWEPWQELFAGWGWESHAYSLPGHGASPVQRSLRWATLNYYLEFLKAEIQRLPHRPVLMGHSMGGALTQMYLKSSHDLPAAVLVASWPSHTMLPSIFRSVRRDPLGRGGEEESAEEREGGGPREVLHRLHLGLDLGLHSPLLTSSRPTRARPGAPSPS